MKRHLGKKYEKSEKKRRRKEEKREKRIMSVEEYKKEELKIQ
jgi:hypothetical protein